MKVLLINGSPRRQGCTATALGLVAEGLKQGGVASDVFELGSGPIAGCAACKKCWNSAYCVVEDKVNEFLALTEQYDGFVVGSPVHFASAGGILTTFLDRACFASSKKRGRFAFKPAAAVVSARRAGTTAALDQLNKYFMYFEMPIISSRYWNMVHGNTPQEVMRDHEGVQIMRILGRNMAWFLHCKEAALSAGIPIPEEEPGIYTNFVLPD